MLKAYFNEKAIHQAQTDHNYSMGGNIEEGIGRIATTSKQIHNSRRSISKKEKTRRYIDQVLRVLEEARRALIAEIAQMQIELEKFINDRDEVIDKKNAISKVLDDLRNDGKIEVGEDGYPTDQHAKTAIKEWEQRTGKKFDANSPEAAEMLHLIILDLKMQESELDRHIANKSKEIEKANELLEDLDAGIEAKNNNGKVNEKTINNAESIVSAEKNLNSELVRIDNSKKLENLETTNGFIDVTTDFDF